ncbi:MAG: TonB-dependent receptor [Bacteroidales bacterium]|nr:TonB-dependent receptor [Bacteroidales bacterium]
MKSRLISILLLLAVLSGLVPVYGQTRSVTVHEGRIEAGEFLQILEKQTGYTFAYKTSDIDLSAVVDADADGEDILTVLRQALSSQNLDFTLSGTRIVISRKEQGHSTDKGRHVSGRVLDPDNSPVIGAVVMTSGLNGTITDENGAFRLALSGGENSITVECLGYSSKKVNLTSSQDNLVIYLAEDAMNIEETVVVGYGVQKKINLTGAISTVETKALADRPSQNLGHMLQGSVPGLFVTTSSGDPEAEISINIRGYNSINGGKPLVLIDGVEGDMTIVNPADVESISVIKDASSAAIYGARASFGVVLITTKSGSANDGKPTVRYNGKVGFSAPTTRTDYETTGYWSVYINDYFYNSSFGRNWTRYTEEDMNQLWLRRNDKTENPERPWVLTEVRDGKESYIYYCNTDWYHEMFRDINPFTQHNVSVNGGNKFVKYFFSAGYEHKEGVFQVRPEKFNKYNLRSKTDFALTKWMTLSNNMNFYTTDYDYPGNAGQNITFQYSGYHAFASMPLQNPDGTWVYKTIFTDSNVANGCHMELGQDTKQNHRYRYNFSNTAELSVRPVEGLDIRANFTYTMDINKSWNRSTPATYSKYPGVIETDDNGRFWNRLLETHDQSKYISTNIYGTYNRTFGGNHNMQLTAGYNYETWYQKKHSTEAHNLSSLYLSDYEMVLPLEDGTYNWNIHGGQSEYALQGFFARANYDYKGKYLFEASIRFDGTSRFVREHRWGYFPSASAGWRFSEEDFFAPVKGWWDLAKIRFSVGSLGNQQVGYYDFIRTINKKSGSYMFEGETSMGSMVTVSNPNASDFTWETTNHYNLGLDMAFFGNRLAFTGEAYIRQTKGMLTSGEPLPEVYGAGSPMKNAADLCSYGYELSLEWKDAFALGSKPFSYSVRATLSDYVTKITKFKNPTRLLGSYYEGMTIGEIWGYTTDGFFKTDEEAQAYAKQVDLSDIAAGLNDGWRAGDLKYLDLNSDGIINSGGYSVDSPGDKKIIGNTEPRWQYGITLSASWNGIDISTFIQGIGRINMYPDGENRAFWNCYTQIPLSFLPKNYMDNIWSEDNPGAYFSRPRAEIAKDGNSYLGTVNDHYLQNIGYIRMRNLTVGYSLPVSVCRKAKFDSLRIYLSGENLWYWSPLRKATKYLDPEMAYSKKQFGYGYPWQRTFVLGLDITF